MRATSVGHAGILIESDSGSILCDPWFVPAFLGSWFVFPRNDQLSADLMERILHADFLYISHLHADHLDLPWLRDNLRRDITIVLPGYPTAELERTLRSVGFTEFIHTESGKSVEVAHNLTVTIWCETSIADGPGGDSAIVVDDGRSRVLNQNDCRPHDSSVFTADGPIDVHWLQYSGAIWYPMVYDEPREGNLELARAKVEAQFARALQYVSAVGATTVAPSAGPPCFLDPDLRHLNVITGSELSIFPDQTALLARLAAAGSSAGRLVVPGTCFVIADGVVTLEQPSPPSELMRPFERKDEYLDEYAADWAGWLFEHRASWASAQPNLVGRLAAWWKPLLALAPSVRVGVGDNLLLVAGDESILVDFPNGDVRTHRQEPYRFRFDIDRRLVETVLAQRAVDWSNALFLSCRFRAWRNGPFNEHVYNFFKSLSAERMERTECEAADKLTADEVIEFVELGDWIVGRYCPHRRADLSRFGEVDGTVLTCSLHGWQFDLANDGRCITADGPALPVRPRRNANNLA